MLSVKAWSACTLWLEGFADLEQRRSHRWGIHRWSAVDLIMGRNLEFGLSITLVAREAMLRTLAGWRSNTGGSKGVWTSDC